MHYPDLTKIEEDAWPAVLTPFAHALRLRAARNQYLGRRMAAAVDLVYSMPPSATDRARAAVKEGTAFPVPRARPGWRQVTVRISDADYEDLTVAARMLGARPAQLARMLVLNGTRRALADQDA